MYKHLYRNWYVYESLCYREVSYKKQECFEIFTNLGETLFPNYFYTNFTYPSNVGNTVKCSVATEGSSIAELSISDGTKSVVAFIGNGRVSIGSNIFYVDTTAFNYYELSLLNGNYSFYINHVLVEEGIAENNINTPIIYCGFYTDPQLSDIAYISYIYNERYNTQRFIVKDWELSNINNYTRANLVGVSCAKITSVNTDGMVTPAYFYKSSVFSDTTGNTLSTKLALGSGDTTPILSVEDEVLLSDNEEAILERSSQVSGPVQLCVSDGQFMIVADIHSDKVIIENNTFSLNALVFHDYWLTLKNGKYQLFVDKELVFEGNATNSISRLISVGFTRIPTEDDTVYIKYLKTAQGEKRPIDLSKVSCELQVDTSDTFSSTNLKTYYSVDDLVFAKQDGANKVYINVNEDNDATARTITITLDGVSGDPVLISANDTSDTIATALYTQGVPDGWTATINGTKIILTKSSITPIQHTTKEYNHLEITGENSIDITFDIFHKGTALGTGIVRSFTIPLLPRQEDEAVCYFFRVRVNNDYYTSDWAYYFYDEPAVDIVFSTKEQLSNNKYIVNRLVAFCYENRQSYMLIENPTPADKVEGFVSIKDSLAIWKPISNSLFVLDSNNANYYFEQVYNNRLPDSEVYTKYDYSGNIANAISSESTIIDIADFELKNANRDLDVHLCRDSYLYNNFGSLYNLAPDYFNTINEYRDTLLNVIEGYCKPGNTQVLKNILSGITGAEPIIEELKNKKTWIIWDRATSLSKNAKEKYILFNPEHPYSDKNKAVLYTNQGKAFTFNIHLYNPLGLAINSNMVRIIVDLFKPVYSQANIIFYDEEGLPKVYPAEYYFSNYGQGLYYAKDTQEEV